MTFPAVALALVVELFIGGVWVDISTYVQGIEGRNAIRITYGRANEQGRVAPRITGLTLKDPTGRFNGDNPAGPYYRQIGRNTALRVRVGSDVRATVELGSIVPQEAEVNTIIRVPVEAGGILRRYDAGQNKPLRSPQYRAIMASSPIAYWPLEDGSEAAEAKPAVGRVPLTGTAKFGSADVFPGSAPALQTVYDPRASPQPDESTSLAAALALSTTSTLWRIELSVLAPNATVVDDLAPAYLLDWSAPGTTEYLTLVADETDHTLKLKYKTAAGLGTVVTGLTVRDGLPHHIRFDGTQIGADLQVRIYVDGTLGGIDTLIGVTVGLPNRLGIFNFEDVAAELWPALAHIAIWDSQPTSTTVEAATGHAGETAAARLARLCDEEGITFSLVGNAADTALVGPQQREPLLELLHHPAEVDRGILYEPREPLGLEYRTRVSLYNQVPALQAGYTSKHLSGPFSPVIDDQRVHNDVEVSRFGGSSARYVIPDDDFWHLTTQSPADFPAGGVGIYDDQATINASDDDQLDDIAAWWAHIAAWKEARFPTVKFDLTRPAIADDAALSAAIRAVNMGDLLVVDTSGSHGWLPPDEVQLLVQGGTEILAQFQWDFLINTVPARPYEVWQVDTGGSTLVSAIDSDDTTLKLATSLGPDWSTTREPYHIQIAGEAMTVTAMVTDTPAFVAAGTVAHGNNASVAPGLPAGMAAGGSMFCFAAIRNSGTGTVDTPAGWTVKAESGNCKLLHRYYVAGDAAPTITFTGGAASADTSARIFGFSGLSGEISSGLKSAPAAYTQLNGSAQDIAYPLSTHKRAVSTQMLFVWKQDDATGVAPPGSYTEMGDNSTTTGNDQLIAAYYVLNSASQTAAGSAVVTGGASAISRAIVVAFRPTQTATVTRSINGVVGSIAAAEAVHGWRMGVIAL